MEKKNTILLTVIAVATLLVAVVGATFAYFTATANTNSASNTTNVTTANVAGATLDMEAAAKKEYLTYPGGYAYTGVTVKANKADTDNSGNDYRISYNLKLEFTNGTKTAISYKLYESTTALTETKSCQPKVDTTTKPGETLYYYTCTGDENNYGTLVTAANASGTIDAAGETPTTVSKTVALTADTDAAIKYYYLVVDYENDAANSQNADMGKTISAAITGIDGTPVQAKK